MSAISIPVLTTAALANGLNPCGIGMLITFLGYLMVFGGKRKKREIALMGGVYLLAMFVTYLMLGLIFYGAAFYMQRWWIAKFAKYLVGVAIMLMGGVQIKDAFWPDLPIHLRMSAFGYEKLNKLMAKMSLPVSALIGVLTTAFSTPCMLPLYAGTAVVLSRSGLGMAQVLGYFLYYNLVFLAPMLVVFGVMVMGKEIVNMKEWEHKNTKWMRLVMGLFMLGVGYLIIK